MSTSDSKTAVKVDKPIVQQIHELQARISKAHTDANYLAKSSDPDDRQEAAGIRHDIFTIMCPELTKLRAKIWGFGNPDENTKVMSN